MLERIERENDIKQIAKEDRGRLATEIREFLIGSISETGGHLGSNLGAVELTMALHLSLDLPKDKIIWDVGHQSYTHKLLTGRREGFATLRKYGGMSGFPKRKESACDAFDTGHSSTSVSAGLGMVCARDLRGGDETIVAVIGDGALTGGMAYEALNNAAQLRTNYIIVLNDNNMSISENVGGVPNYLNSLRTTEGYQNLKEDIYHKLMNAGSEGMVRMIQRTKSSIKQLMTPGMLFEDMGITYLGPIDGHDIDAMLRAMRYAKRVRHAVMIHVLTQKGRGYEPAERHPARFHGAEPFHIDSGLPKRERSKANYTDVFSTVMCSLGKEREDVVAVTAAMADGTGLKRFCNQYPSRSFDVGIAEEHAVTFAAGLAAGGLRPVVAIYSSFLQRAYDQILHDVCLQNMPVTFAVDRAGLVGADGETHQGIFDLSYLSTIPNMSVCAPKNKWELADMLRFAVSCGSPMAVRYPRGEAYDGLEEQRAPIEMGRCELLAGPAGGRVDVCLLAVGSMVATALTVRERLLAAGCSCTLINVRFVKPMDPVLADYAQRARLAVTMEENVITGGFGERFALMLAEATEGGDAVAAGAAADRTADAGGMGSTADAVTGGTAAAAGGAAPAGGRPALLHIALPDAYVEHGNVDLLKQEVGIDGDSIYHRIIERLSACPPQA